MLTVLGALLSDILLALSDRNVTASLRLTALTRMSDDFWSRTIFHIRSVASPFDSPAVASLAVTVLTRAEAMGLLHPTETIERLDMDAFRRLVEEIAGAGVGNGLLPDLAASRRPSARQLSVTLRKLSEALDASPTPASEWRGVNRVLGGDVLARLLGISSSSVRRIGDLAGAYNDFGVRRWFQRPRKLLGTRSPAQFLSGTWRPEDPGPQRVRDLAAALVYSPAT